MIAQGSQRLAAVNSLSLLILGTVVLVADILTSNAHFVPRDSAHCIVWRTWQRESQHDNSATRDATSPSDIFQAFEALEAGGAPLCRLSPINHGYHATGSRANSFDDLMPPNMVIPIGVLDPVSGMCTFEGQENSTGHVEIATTDPSCDVWWRTVTSDVMPPMTEMAMQFAMSALSQPRNSRDEKELQIMFGICRSPMSETERPRLGTLILNGRDVGHCVIPEGTGGSTTVLVGGGYDIVQAREGFAGGCEDDPLEASSRAAELDSHFRQFISDEDRIMLESVTGHDSHALEAAILRLGSCDLRQVPTNNIIFGKLFMRCCLVSYGHFTAHCNGGQVMSSARFVPHELNHQGLTLLRHVLAERMYDARQAALGSHLHPDFEQWRRDGILVKKLDQLSDEDVLGLLRMVSGEHSLGIPTKVEWSPRFTVHAPGDPQYETHIDNAVGPIFKAWVSDLRATPTLPLRVRVTWCAS